MESNAILCCVSAALYVVLLATWPVRRKKIRAGLGECVFPLSRKRSRLFVAVVVIAPLLIALTRLRDFGLVVNAVLCASALLAAELSIRDSLFAALAGVYRGGLVVDGRHLPFDQIAALPELGYENEDGAEESRDEFYGRSLEIVTERSGVVRVGFASREEKDAAVSSVLGLVPRLAP